MSGGQGPASWMLDLDLWLIVVFNIRNLPINKNRRRSTNREHEYKLVVILFFSDTLTTGILNSGLLALRCTLSSKSASRK